MSGDVVAEPVHFDSIRLPESQLSPGEMSELRRIFGDDGVRVDRLSRVLHAYGKSYRDLLRLRRGDISHPPDAVVYPANEDQIAQLFGLAASMGWHVIPFGGGSSVTGGVEPPSPASSPRARQPAITLDLARLNRVVSIDGVSHTAAVQSGIAGPELEAGLNARGYTLGHFPQSFEFSTLGGWIATRSAGQTSTGYGKIEDMVERVRVVTPRGVIDVKPLPASATGPDILRLLVGSEGAFGVIVEASLRIRPLPEARNYRGVLFRTFEDGLGAIRQLMQSEIGVVMARLSDRHETAASLALSRTPGTRRAQLRLRAGQWLVRRQGYDIASSCLMILAAEGPAARVERITKAALQVCKSHRGIDLGRSIGWSWLRERYALPYLRDDLLDRGIMIDTLETATTWSRLPELYDALTEALRRAIAASGAQPYVMTHVSHAYRDGASLYSTFLGAQRGDPTAQWWSVKQAATQAILANGGALSHHHGIGRDHAGWLEQEHGPLGIEALRVLKANFDPDGLLNRGVLIR